MYLGFLIIGIVVVSVSTFIWKDFASGLVGFIVGGILFGISALIIQLISWMNYLQQ